MLPWPLRGRKREAVTGKLRGRQSRTDAVTFIASDGSCKAGGRPPWRHAAAAIARLSGLFPRRL
eukprot:15220129-Alexandrium_andersonii.AAC.1